MNKNTQTIKKYLNNNYRWILKLEIDIIIEKQNIKNIIKQIKFILKKETYNFVLYKKSLLFFCTNKNKCILINETIQNFIKEKLNVEINIISVVIINAYEEVFQFREYEFDKDKIYFTEDYINKVKTQIELLIKNYSNRDEFIEKIIFFLLEIKKNFFECNCEEIFLELDEWINKKIPKHY